MALGLPAQPTCLRQSPRLLRGLDLQSMPSEAFVRRPTLIRQLPLEVAELGNSLAVRRKPCRAFHRRVPVRCPHAITGPRAWRPMQHAFAESNAEFGA